MSNRRKLKSHRPAPSRVRHMPSPPDLSGYPGPGDVNGYRCKTCGQITTTVHVDQGVTPMFLACRATEGCDGTAVSFGYQAPADRLPAPSFEWYRPTGRELARMSAAMVDHVAQGGLVLRPVTKLRSV